MLCCKSFVALFSLPLGNGLSFSPRDRWGYWMVESALHWPDLGLRILVQTLDPFPLYHGNLNSEGRTQEGKPIGAESPAGSTLERWPPVSGTEAVQKDQCVIFSRSNHLIPYNPECHSASPNRSLLAEAPWTVFCHLQRFLLDLFLHLNLCAHVYFLGIYF